MAVSAHNLISVEKQKSNQHQQILQDIYTALQKYTSEWLYISLPATFHTSYSSYNVSKEDLDRAYEEIKVLLKYMNICWN